MTTECFGLVKKYNTEALADVKKVHFITSALTLRVGPTFYTQSAGGGQVEQTFHW